MLLQYEYLYFIFEGNVATRQVVNRERLRAALKASEFETANQLAKAAGVRHPTISRYLSEINHSMNASTVERLAAALRVPADWLTEDGAPLPFVPEKGPFTPDEMSLWETPGASNVRHSHLMTEISAALLRDLRRWYGEEADLAYRSWGGGLILAFECLANPTSWRFAGIRASGSPIVYVALDNQSTVDWLRDMLAPWIAGEADLGAQILRRIVEAMLGNPDDPTSQIEVADSLRGLEEYEKAQTKQTATTAADGDDDA